MNWFQKLLWSKIDLTIKQEAVSQIREDFKSMSVEEICNKYGIVRESFYPVNRVFKLKPKDRRNNGKLKKAGFDFKKIKSLREQGLSYNKIGGLVGVSRQRIHQILTMEGEK